MFWIEELGVLQNKLILIIQQVHLLPMLCLDPISSETEICKNVMFMPCRQTFVVYNQPYFFQSMIYDRKALKCSLTRRDLIIFTCSKQISSFLRKKITSEYLCKEMDNLSCVSYCSKARLRVKLIRLSSCNVYWCLYRPKQ